MTALCVMGGQLGSDTDGLDRRIERDLDDIDVAGIAGVDRIDYSLEAVWPGRIGVRDRHRDDGRVGWRQQA